MQISIFMPETDCFPTWIKKKNPEKFFPAGLPKKSHFCQYLLFLSMTKYFAILLSWANYIQVNFMSYFCWLKKLRKLFHVKKIGVSKSNVKRFLKCFSISGSFEFDRQKKVNGSVHLSIRTWIFVIFERTILNGNFILEYSKNTSFIRKDRDFSTRNGILGSKLSFRLENDFGKKMSFWL